MLGGALHTPDYRTEDQYRRDSIFGACYIPIGLVILFLIIIGRTGQGWFMWPILLGVLPTTLLFLIALRFVTVRQRMRPPEFTIVGIIAHIVMWIGAMLFALSLSDRNHSSRFPSYLELLFGRDTAATMGFVGVIAAVAGWSVALVAGITTLIRQAELALVVAEEEEQGRSATRALLPQ